MKDLVKVGDSVQTTFVVTANDTATFNGEEVHNVCSTFVISREAEWCSRQFAIKMKEEEEEGVGTHITVNHDNPAFIGDTISFEAVVESIKGHEIFCSYTAYVSDRLVAHGTTGQKILSKEKIAQIFSKFE